MQLTQVEQEIVIILRELKPYERVELTKDQTGKPDCYIVHRSQKIVFDRK